MQRNSQEKYGVTARINTYRDFILFADVIRKIHYKNKKYIFFKDYLGIAHIFKNLLREIASRMLTIFVPLPSGDKFGQNLWTAMR